MKKVLVVEDNSDDLQIITCSLQRAGYEVIAAVTGEEGVELAIATRPFFIIMDINLPGIDGLEATSRIRASEVGNSIPIIALTAYIVMDERDKIMDAGCNGYIEKPIDPGTVVDQIHKRLQ